MSLPDATKSPCNECPWRRKAAPGYLGPMDPDEWLEAAHSDVAIACHKSIKEAQAGVGDWDHPVIRQCRGAAIFRANVCKSPRDPEVVTGPVDRESVFSNNREFKEHHAPMYEEYYGPARQRNG